MDIREAIFSISGIGNASRMTYADDMRIHVNISFDKELKVGMGYDLLCSGLMDLEGNKIPESSTEIRLEYEEEPEYKSMYFRNSACPCYRDPDGTTG